MTVRSILGAYPTYMIIVLLSSTSNLVLLVARAVYTEAIPARPIWRRIAVDVCAIRIRFRAQFQSTGCGLKETILAVAAIHWGFPPLFNRIGETIASGSWAEASGESSKRCANTMENNSEAVVLPVHFAKKKSARLPSLWHSGTGKVVVNKEFLDALETNLSDSYISTHFYAVFKDKTSHYVTKFDV